MSSERAFCRILKPFGAANTEPGTAAAHWQGHMIMIEMYADHEGGRSQGIWAVRKTEWVWCKPGAMAICAFSRYMYRWDSACFVADRGAGFSTKRKLLKNNE
ncbi:hypothetical protein HPP92_028888 [Vanilla planifolia]|uniref:Uncharacterized protein n=1 Tax=Vanilla planifolia TaxID=51239 RepID=A0A835P5Q3_VANPL|nr:hypothetical protein HPP92_028888 [Vanilla planifolia]KAG0446349.1 hypothetical protein HPP92_028877 [Vanilla planifolia]